MRTVAIPAFAAIAALAVAATPARAQRPGVTRGEVLVVLAKEAAGHIDPALARVPALRRPPFNSFRTMEILSRPSVDLRLGQPTTVRLPNGRRLQLVLQSVMPDGRYRVRVSINRPDQNDYLPLLQVVASPGDPFFVAGQSYQGGTLVIGVRVGERRTRGASATSATSMAAGSMAAHPTRR